MRAGQQLLRVHVRRPPLNVHQFDKATLYHPIVLVARLDTHEHFCHVEMQFLRMTADHLQMIILREKFVSQPGFEPQISSSPYWRLNQLGHCDTHTDQERNLSLLQVSIQGSRECNMLLFFFRATHKWVLYFGFTYILTSHLVLGLYLTLILKMFISDGHIDDIF